MDTNVQTSVCYAFEITGSNTTHVCLNLAEQMGFVASAVVQPEYRFYTDMALSRLALVESVFVDTAADVVMVGHSDVLPLYSPQMVADLLGDDDVVFLLFPPEVEGKEELGAGFLLMRRSGSAKMSAPFEELVEATSRFLNNGSSNYQALRALFVSFDLSCRMHYLRDGDYCLPDGTKRAEFHQEIPCLGPEHGYVYRDHKGRPVAINLYFTKVYDLRPHAISLEQQYRWRAYEAARSYNVEGFIPLTPLVYSKTYGPVERAWKLFDRSRKPPPPRARR